MSALEEEILARIRLLDRDARKRVIELAQSELDAQHEFDFGAWQKRAVELREQIQADLGEGETIDTLALLDEVRQESL